MYAQASPRIEQTITEKSKERKQKLSRQCGAATEQTANKYQITPPGQHTTKTFPGQRAGEGEGRNIFFSKNKMLRKEEEKKAVTAQSMVSNFFDTTC